MATSLVCTFITYLASIIFLNQYINTSKISPIFFVKVLIIVCVSWLPIHIFKVIFRRFYPSIEDKVMITD